MRLQQIAQKAHRSRQTFVQTERSIGHIGANSELLAHQKARKRNGSMPVLWFARLSEHDQKAICVAGDTVTNARSLAQ